VNSRYYLTFRSTFQSEKPKKLEKTSLNDKFFDWDYLYLAALMKETYFSLKKLFFFFFQKDKYLKKAKLGMYF
jgi:hypothetical protein